MLNESIKAGTTGHHQRARDYCMVVLIIISATVVLYYTNLQ